MMFGQRDDQQASDDHKDDNTVAPTMLEPTADGSLGADTGDADAAQTVDTTPAPATTPAATPQLTTPDPSDDTPTYLASPSEPENAHSVTGVADDGLLHLKQEALEQLSPLLGHLDQTPEEKFRTTMMMIQASDNQSLLQAAYEAARQIPEEKVRAQALLDVVNEINYFTQHNES